MAAPGRILATLLLLAVALPAAARPGDAERGLAIYAGRCLMCHGKEGDGLGPAAERLNPPPRDFTLGLYKIKTTAFDDEVPNDADLMRMVRDGMPGSVMPGWGDVLSDDEMGDVIAYIKTFAELEEEQPTNQLDRGEPVASSADSIEAGRKLFHDDDRCSECHGSLGKGDAVKKLKGDNGERTWPRNLTKAWTFRASNHPRDVFARISIGIPGTQMPPFANPKSKKKLSIEERWHVANYVASLAETQRVVRPENTVVKADKIEGPVPDDPLDERWAEAEPVTFFLLPQIIAEKRFFTPSNDTITVRALYGETEVALLLEWDDRTKSTPGDATAEGLAEPGMGEDAVAVQFPLTIPEAMEKPYFLRGDAANPVTLWRWSGGTTESPQRARQIDARGYADMTERDAGAGGVSAKGVYAAGTWRVVLKRALRTETPDADLQFVEGRYIPIAFSAWDGSNGETGSKHTLSTWYWLLLKQPAGATPLVAALAVFFLIVLAEVWWAASPARRRPDEAD
jgi:DMSO reductase family type II enzyme heme b subunit